MHLYIQKVSLLLEIKCGWLSLTYHLFDVRIPDLVKQYEVLQSEHQLRAKLFEDGVLMYLKLLELKLNVLKGQLDVVVCLFLGLQFLFLIDGILHLGDIH